MEVIKDGRRYQGGVSLWSPGFKSFYGLMDLDKANSRYIGIVLMATDSGQA